MSDDKPLVDRLRGRAYELSRTLSSYDDDENAGDVLRRTSELLREAADHIESLEDECSETQEWLKTHRWLPLP